MLPIYPPPYTKRLHKFGSVIGSAFNLNFFLKLDPAMGTTLQDVSSRIRSASQMHNGGKCENAHTVNYFSDMR